MAAVTVKRYDRHNESAGSVFGSGVHNQPDCKASGSKASALIFRAIRWYQVHISAHNPPCCKYYPSCSNYALEAVRRYGAVKGGLLAALRLLRCRPWSLGGIDDVPRHYSVFYRFSWSKAHEEPRLTPLPSLPDSVVTEDECGVTSTTLEKQAALPIAAVQTDAKNSPDSISDIPIRNSISITYFKSSALKETAR